jgi:hypothetical protein
MLQVFHAKWHNQLLEVERSEGCVVVVTEPPQGGGSSTRINLSDSR